MDLETLKYFQSKTTEELTELVKKHNTQIYKEEAFEIMQHILDERNKESARYMPGYVKDIQTEEEKNPNPEKQEVDEILQLTPPPIPQNESNTNEESFEAESKSKTSSTQKQRMFSNPFSFQGRIRRTEFGISFIIYFVIAVILNVTFVYASGLYWFFYIPVQWFILAQGAKRCHDMGNSGWFQIIPFYILWMLFAKGEEFSNQYDINLKY